jgi:hypothetical protein
MKEVHVLCQNDFPHSVFVDRATAEKECERLNKEDEERAGRRIFYHLNTVPFITEKH